METSESGLEDKMSEIKISVSDYKLFNTTPIKEVYKITRKIGSGAYGEVRK